MSLSQVELDSAVPGLRVILPPPRPPEKIGVPPGERRKSLLVQEIAIWIFPGKTVDELFA
jgi:hypothetical protein